MKIFCVLILIFTSVTISLAQENLICKSWKKNYATLNGEIAKNETNDENYRVTFFENHDLEYLENKMLLKGSWKLDFQNKFITFNFENGPKNFVLDLIKLTENELVLELKQEENKGTKTLYLIPSN